MAAMKAERDKQDSIWTQAKAMPQAEAMPQAKAMPQAEAKRNESIKNNLKTILNNTLRK
jgi:hypothetical protein